MRQTARSRPAEGCPWEADQLGKWHWDWHSAVVGISPDRGWGMDSITDKRKIITDGDAF